MKYKFQITLILVLSAIAAAGFSFGKFYQNISAKEKEVLQLREKLAVIEKKKMLITDLKRFLRDINKDEQKIKSVFLNEQDIVQFIEKLEEVSRLAGAQIEIQSAVVPDQNNPIPSFNFQINGGFENIFSSLLFIENLPYQIEIQELRFIKLGKEAENSDWQAQFRIKVLSFISA